MTQSEKNRAAAAAAATTQREGSMKVYVSGVHKNIDSEDLKEVCLFVRHSVVLFFFFIVRELSNAYNW